jgi:hypothetical protein
VCTEIRSVMEKDDGVELRLIHLNSEEPRSDDYGKLSRRELTYDDHKLLIAKEFSGTNGMAAEFTFQ